VGDLHQLWREQQRVHEVGALRQLFVHGVACVALGVIIVEATRRGDWVTVLVAAGGALPSMWAGVRWWRLAARARRNRRGR
jgi:hypothetical protein